MSRTLNVILASTQTGCIGSGGSLPWEIPSDLIRFKRITTGGTLIVGRRTAESLPELQGRDLLIVSRSLSRDDPRVCRSFQEAVDRGSNGCRPLFVAGGAQIYNEVFKEHNQGLIDKIHYSLVDGEYPGDTHIAFPTHDFVIVSEEKAEGHVHYVLRPSRTGERQYLITMKSILTGGEHYRGRNGDTIQIFGETTLCFDLRDGFPLLTTKKMFFRGIAEELLFFLRGDTDTRLLEDKNVNIWKENTSRNFLDSVGKTNRREGVMGPMYGYQWRTYGAPYDEQKAAPEEGAEGYDQLRRVVEQISKEPNSRRILMTTYNPLQVEEGVLHPCHSIVLQFHVNHPFLDMTCYNRSQDAFLGMPFNIASSSLLLCIVARMTGLMARKFTLYGGCVHLYCDHLDAARSQLSRIPYKFPVISLPSMRNLDDIAKLTADDFGIDRYISHSRIMAPMSV